MWTCAEVCSVFSFNTTYRRLIGTSCRVTIGWQTCGIPTPPPCAMVVSSIPRFRIKPPTIGRAGVVARRGLATDSPTTARIDAGFPADGQEGFASEAYSATNVRRKTGPRGRFFIARNPVLARDFARFCRCHARPNPARFPSLASLVVTSPFPPKPVGTSKTPAVAQGYTGVAESGRLR